MTADELEAGKEFGRYLDVDGDGIPYRTYPGTHPTKGAFFTRGTSRDRYARYTEDGAAYVDNMQRLLRKFDTAKDLVPRPLQANADKPTRFGVDLLRLDRAGDGRGDRHARGARARRRPRCASAPSRSIRASATSSPSTTSSSSSSRTATRSCARCSSTRRSASNPAISGWCRSLHYDGTPITARFIASAIAQIGRPTLDHARCADQDGQRADVMTYLAKPKFHHPNLPKNELGYTHRDYEGTVSTLCAGCGHDSITRRDHPGLLRAVDRAAPRRQAVRHRLLVEDADLLPRQLARLQHRARPHAVGPDRRQPRQPRPDLSRRLRRRRLAPRSASASSPTACAAASTWSTSSRTTASTA